MFLCCIFNSALLWTAIGSVATGVMAIATFITIIQNRKQGREFFRQNFENTLFSLIKEFKDARTRIYILQMHVTLNVNIVSCCPGINWKMN